MTETMNWNKIVLGEKEVNIPPRFKWVAMDQDGCWWAYISRPYISHDKFWGNINSEKIWIGFIDYKAPDWKKSVRKI